MGSSPERPTRPAVWLRESDVVETVSLADAIGAIRDCYLRLAGGGIVPMRKAIAAWPGGTMHATGAVAASGGLAICKTWAHTPGGATPLLEAWEADTGRLVAVIEAFALGQLRTSAISGAATDVLAAPRCEVLGVIGAGKQAEGQIAAVAAVRDLQKVKVYSPTKDRRTDLAARVADRAAIAANAVDSAHDALDGADVVVTVTRAREPVVSRSMLREGAHINAVGAISPERAELEPDVVAAARRVVADDVDAARRLAAREMSHAPHVLALADLLANPDSRPEAGDLTIFKALGSGVSDLAIAELVIERAMAAGRGHPLPDTQRRQPRMWSAS